MAKNLASVFSFLRRAGVCPVPYRIAHSTANDSQRFHGRRRRDLSQRLYGEGAPFFFFSFMGSAKPEWCGGLIVDVRSLGVERH